MIVIPMAGLSSRFKKAGFTLPKYMLEAHGKTLFYHSLMSFNSYFETQSFLFIALEVSNTKNFIEKECEKLGIKNFEIVILDAPTRGQAESVSLGLNSANVEPNEPILIFNIDTFRPGYKFPTDFDFNQSHGYLETFIGSGENWSNIAPASTCKKTVRYTAEKKEISEFCCTGLYYFAKAQLFVEAFQEYSKLDLENVDAREYYIAPMYNFLINQGLTINYSVIPRDEVIFCGVPDEFYAFLKSKYDSDKDYW